MNTIQQEKVTIAAGVEMEDLRMSNESEFKKIFRDSLERQGGFSFPIAMSSMSGLPDLYCVAPNHIPVLLEGKWFKDIPENGKFKRKIPYRPLQREYLKNANRVVKGSGWGLMGFDCGEKKYCALVVPELEIVTQDILIDPFRRVEIIKNNIDIGILFYRLVPRIAKMACENCT